MSEYKFFFIKDNRTAGVKSHSSDFANKERDSFLKSGYEEITEEEYKNIKEKEKAEVLKNRYSISEERKKKNEEIAKKRQERTDRYIKEHYKNTTKKIIDNLRKNPELLEELKELLK